MTFVSVSVLVNCFHGKVLYCVATCVVGTFHIYFIDLLLKSAYELYSVNAKAAGWGFSSVAGCVLLRSHYETLIKKCPTVFKTFVAKYCHLKIIAYNTGVQLFPLQKPSQIYRVLICIAPQPY